MRGINQKVVTATFQDNETGGNKDTRRGETEARVSKGCINRDKHGSHPRKTTRAKRSSRTTPFTTTAADESCSRHHDNSKPENNKRGAGTI